MLCHGREKGKARTGIPQGMLREKKIITVIRGLSDHKHWAK